MLGVRFITFFLTLFLALTAGSLAAEARVFTLWPAIDYRSSTETDYSSLHLLGPLIKYERRGAEHDLALRPFYYRNWIRESSSGEFLYPFATAKSSDHRTFWQSLQLLQYDFGERESGSQNRAMLFPFLFYGETAAEQEYFAFFPFGGRLHEKFGRDRIRFALFPLYSQTQKKDTTITNVLWPLFAKVTGENETGLKFWPLFGFSEKEGVYRKRFFLWPIFFRDDLALDTESPRRRRAAFPFYLSVESPDKVSRSLLWPFFHYRRDNRKGVEEWDLPWPLVRISHGEEREGRRFLPFYADERSNGFRKRSFLWPIYRIEELHSPMIDRRRDRVLFFLFSRLQENKREALPASKHRIDFWPLFSFQRKDGMAHFHTLSLLEPFFPENQGIQRNWSPLWRFYQARWDDQGNAVSSFLWNLYWKERRGNELAMELFPFFSWRREAATGTDLTLLKGLFRYRSGVGGQRLRVLFLPLRWGGGEGQDADEGG